jgi:hypothetical protein
MPFKNSDYYIYHIQKAVDFPRVYLWVHTMATVNSDHFSEQRVAHSYEKVAVRFTVGQEV